MSRRGDWWKWANQKPVPQPTAPGRATIPYPRLHGADRTAFARCEEYLLREILDAGACGRDIADRGDVPFNAGWVIMPGRVHSALVEDTKGHGPARQVMEDVVTWLEHAGALDPLTDHQRKIIAESNVADRERRRPGWPGGSVRDWDDDVWEVNPERMLAVYPHLADANDDWKQAADR